MFSFGGLLGLSYLLAALGTGVLLYWRNPALYLGFAWWVWFLTPEVRRLVDYQLGWNPTNPIMLAPLLVTAIAFFTLLRHLPKLPNARFFPFALVFSGLFYGYAVGAFKSGVLNATFDLLNWLVPVILAFFIAVHWRSYPVHRRAIQRTFIWGALVMGLYGIVQFLDPPAWDRQWMLSAPIGSIGLPEPFEVRVFSTLNSPGPFAVVMMAALLLCFTRGSVLRWPAAAVGGVSFLLSLVRSAWGGWVIGLVFILAQRGGTGLRLLVTLMVVGVLSYPLLVFGPVADVVDERMQSVTNIERDESFIYRVRFYTDFLPRAFFNLLGEGLGSTGVATKLSTAEGSIGELGNFDSGLMRIPFVLGWPGSLLYVGGLVLMLAHAFRSGRAQTDLFAAASRGIVVAVLVQLVFDNFLTGVPGMVLWTFLGLALAARTYYDRKIPQSVAGEPVSRDGYEDRYQDKSGTQKRPIVRVYRPWNG